MDTMTDRLFIDQDGDACLEPADRDDNLVALPARDDDGNILNPEAWERMVKSFNAMADLKDSLDTLSSAMRRAKKRRGPMTDQLPERIWAEVIDPSGCGHFGPTKMAESETLFLRADTAVTKAEAGAMVAAAAAVSMNSMSRSLSGVIRNKMARLGRAAELGELEAEAEKMRSERMRRSAFSRKRVKPQGGKDER